MIVSVRSQKFSEICRRHTNRSVSYNRHQQAYILQILLLQDRWRPLRLHRATSPHRVPLVIADDIVQLMELLPAMMPGAAFIPPRCGRGFRTSEGWRLSHVCW